MGVQHTDIHAAGPGSTGHSATYRSRYTLCAPLGRGTWPHYEWLVVTLEPEKVTCGRCLHLLGPKLSQEYLASLRGTP